MNTSEYIESGVLELYVSGLLSIEEMRDVELKACQYPEIKTQLESLQSALERFALNHAIAPRPELKSRIMKAISDEAVKTGSSEGITIKKEPVVRELTASRPNYTGLLAAASVILLAIISGIAFYFSSQYHKANDQIALLMQQQNGLQQELGDLKLAMNQNADKLQLLTDEHTVRVTMKGTDKSPSSIALIYWNKQTKDVYIDIKSLPPTPADKQYQLWFIDPQNGPISAGVFEVRMGEMMKMTNAPDAAAFAVTLEPRGGSQNPTLDQMYVVGNVNS